MTTETKPVLTPQEQAIADFMAEEATPPDGAFALKKGAPLGTSMEGHPLGSKVADVDRGRYIAVYNTTTGRRHTINVIHKPFLSPDHPRAWKNADGRMAFSLRPIKGLTPEVGKLLCYLHAEHPQREHYAEIGIGRSKNCTKRGIPSELDVRKHMDTFHRDAWAIIREDAERAEKKAEREFQRDLLTIARGAPADAGTDSDEDTATYICTEPDCGRLFAAKTAGMAKMRLQKHKKATHKIEETANDNQG